MSHRNLKIKILNRSCSIWYIWYICVFINIYYMRRKCEPVRFNYKLIGCCHSETPSSSIYIYTCNLLYIYLIYVRVRYAFLILILAIDQEQSFVQYIISYIIKYIRIYCLLHGKYRCITIMSKYQQKKSETHTCFTT